MNKFEINYWFSFQEAILSYLGEAEFFTEETFKTMLEELGVYTATPSFNPLGLVFVENFGLSLKIFNRLIERYGQHYLYSNKTNQVEDGKKWSLRKIIRVLDMTFNKYSTILKAYDDNKTKLLDPLKKKETETSSTSQSENHAEVGGSNSLSKMNDTPQASSSEVDPFSSDNYVSELTKIKEENSRNGNSNINGQGLTTREFEDMYSTIMERIQELQSKYDLTIKRWLNEFDDLFIEEMNI